MKMQGKPLVTKANLIAIPLLLFCVLASNADVLQEIVVLLENDKFFGLAT